MEGVPTLPWAGDAGGRIILPKAVTYEQLAAGAVEFQLYNRNTNALIPTDILRVGDHIEIREKETGGDESPYTIDKYDGARSEIALTGDGQATRIWGLMGASFNDSVHSVRTFAMSRDLSGDTKKLVNIEIDGKMYIPYVKTGNAWNPVADNDGEFYADLDFDFREMHSAFPMIETIIDENQTTPGVTLLTVPSIGVQADSRETIEISYKETYNNDEPWRFGQDGFFYVSYGWMVRVNGVNHMLNHEQNSVGNAASYGAVISESSENLYNTPNPSIQMDAADQSDITSAKESAESEFGLTFGEDIMVSEFIDHEVWQPFIADEPA